jgi:hypothetical protein
VQISVIKMSFSSLNCPGIVSLNKGSNKIITLKMGPICCPKTPAKSYEHTLLKTAEDRVVFASDK